MAQGDTAVAFARAQIGKPYVWGATGPTGYDCSGLVLASWRAAGVHLSRTTYTQVAEGRAVSRDNLAVGDLVFPDPGHVQLYSGGGMVVSAPHTGAYVHETKMGTVWVARRVGEPGVAGGNVNVSTVGLTPVSNPIDGLVELKTITSYLSDTGNWVRMAMFAGGSVMLIYAIGKLSGVDSAIIKTVKSAV